MIFHRRHALALFLSSTAAVPTLARLGNYEDGAGGIPATGFGHRSVQAKSSKDNSTSNTSSKKKSKKSEVPSSSPSFSPSGAPSGAPSDVPSDAPSAHPTESATDIFQPITRNAFWKSFHFGEYKITSMKAIGADDSTLCQKWEKWGDSENMRMEVVGCQEILGGDALKIFYKKQVHEQVHECPDCAVDCNYHRDGMSYDVIPMNASEFGHGPWAWMIETFFPFIPEVQFVEGSDSKSIKAYWNILKNACPLEIDCSSNDQFEECKNNNIDCSIEGAPFFCPRACAKQGLGPCADETE